MRDLSSRMWAKNHKYFSVSFDLVTTLWVFLFVQTLIDPLESKACGKDDWAYSYTECDSSGSRWRVAVPKVNERDSCEILKTPDAGKSCTFSCPAGKYLSVQGDQECHDCDEGTYSLGGGLRFDDWTTIPSMLSIHSEKINLDDIYPGMNIGNEGNCTNTWVPKGTFIAGVPGNCASSITLSVTLVKPGKLKYEYQYPDSNVLMSFTAQNNLCQSDDDSSQDGSKWPSTTGSTWKEEEIDLKKGLNTLRWKMISFNLDPEQRLQPILIRRIEVSGVAFTSSCTACSAGTYSAKGAKECKPCSRNFYSARHSATCQKCNEATEYAEPGSSKCETRPACKEKDYYSYHTPCDEKKMTSKMYKWIEPKVCRDDVQDAKKLPPSGSATECPPCNPGMEYGKNDTSSSCRFCPPNTYSDGSKNCTNCPVNTAPAYGYTYQWWNTLPPKMTVACLSMDESGCASTDGWQVSGDHIHSGYGHQDDVYLIMTLEVDGFQPLLSTASSITEVGQISFVFELDCAGKCEFYFMMDIKDKETSVISSWKGHTRKTLYTFIVNDPGAVTFSWAFQKTSWDSLDPSYTFAGDDIAKMYSINVTNTHSGGASQCVPCPLGSKVHRCIPCPSGHYVDDKTSTCQKCPDGTIASSVYGVGIETCVKCGPGLVSDDGVQCYSDCKWTDDASGRTFDFSALAGTHIVEGSRLFTASGTKYYHQFNFTLCGSPEATVACVNNVKSDRTSKDHVTSRVCRTTIIPSSKHKAGIPGLAAQAVSLGDDIVAVTAAHNFAELNMTKEFALKKVDPSTGGAKDIHFYFRSTTPTSACPKGRSTIVTMRCDLDDKYLKGDLSMPPKCADGTCDGCNFNILWKTGAACPICDKNDFHKIKGECHDSLQKIHFVPPKTCRVLTDEEITEVASCTVVLPIIIQIGICTGIGVAALLAILVYYFWYKNRTLEYKYMKLVAGSNGAPRLNQDGEMELPTADSCAMNSDEEEEDNDEFDSIDFKEGGSRKKNLLNKLKTMGGNSGPNHGNYGSDMETNLLNEKVFHEL